MHYRKIWEKHFGKIPDGHEIHHLDGNRKNNNIENLKLVTIDEHFEIHKSQNDIGAMQAILIRMNVFDRKEVAKLASIKQKELIKEGKHNFQKIDRSSVSRETMKMRRDKGLPTFLGIDDFRLNASKGGQAAKEKKAGFLNTQSDNHGSKYTKGSIWWINTETGKRKRSKESPGDNWKKGMHL